MDESWRMRIGVPNGGFRQSGVGRRAPSSELEPEDFDDVFGGPPKSLLARKLSVDFTGNEWFYRQVFQPPEIDVPTSVDGLRLPEFVIPGENRPWCQTRPCKQTVNKRISRSKSTSASVMSLEEMDEMSSYWSGIAREEDVGLSSMTSKLRPINVPSRWSSSSNTSMVPKTKHKKQEPPPFGYPLKTDQNTINNDDDDDDQCNDYMIKSYNNYNNYQSNSPSSLVSSTYHASNTVSDHMIREIDTQDYYISEEIDMNEAIAWAKDKFQGWSLAGQASPREHAKINHT